MFANKVISISRIKTSLSSYEWKWEDEVDVNNPSFAILSKINKFILYGNLIIQVKIFHILF